ncbi:TetR family transcriptional regulator [Devosia insulae DS-56]|uniref:TetR family transcriptional regulator n=1 Tax=Devosia insulae DS-56 TaxID=1116389 RepID=A0A1E5XNU4_9HYPH|nr:TetR family transcriptional regulator [Devosia insulae]OEO30280.1 TetR family transcriptional regulator [Devosia insulae DS-56]
MNEVLTRERILEAAEQVFRRFGPHKTTVVDVARLLGVSHGSVYRHFDSKIALRDAVVEGWLKRTSDPLAAIATSGQAPAQRLRLWFSTLLMLKREKVKGDPELFSVSRTIFAEAREVVARHVDTLVGQLETIIVDGIASGDFRPVDPRATAQAMFDATARFHDPAHGAEWSAPDVDAGFERVYALITAGIVV